MSGRIEAIRLTPEEAPCPYLAAHRARFEHGILTAADEEGFSALLEAGVRHFGAYCFRPACPGPAGAVWCGKCVPLRVDVARFRPTRSQRRVLRGGADVRLEIGAPRYTDEKFEIYRRHKGRFGAPPGADPGEADPASEAESFRGSFYGDFPFTRECVWRREGRIAAISFLDLTRRAASSIYCAFDPDEERLSPGTLTALREIELARELGIPWYYLGYWIERNPSMRYKMRFVPCEAFDGARWRALRDGEGRFAADPAGMRCGAMAAWLG